MTGDELQDELQKLRHQQRNGVTRRRDHAVAVRVDVTDPNHLGTVYPVSFTADIPISALSVSVCRTASVSNIQPSVPRSPSPPMPALVQGSTVHFSSAQFELPMDALSVYSSDLDLSIFESDVSLPASSSVS